MGQEGPELTYKEVVQQYVGARRAVNENYQRALKAERELGLLRGAVSRVLSSLESRHWETLTQEEQFIVQTLREGLDGNV